ncbi:nucleotidyltransferase domain-containing protein [Paenibacillus senegalensis]|uniref:nucleotidyltransferase domain-containing protein n=1 Tax=Paenibacillus senegalensis TaxID=1465766 RepID=UPI0002881F8B|nr:aminoglycoside adenylyltransferase domain-containing protein [Paenibacillus senegalensis]
MIPADVTKIMKRLGDELYKKLDSQLIAIYLYGSTVLDAYVPGKSDIDFIVVLKQSASEADYQAIREAHEEVERQIPGFTIMGAYLSEEDLGKSDHEISRFPTYYNKQLHGDGRGADINPVTWWLLLHYGVCVYGQAVPLQYDISKEKLSGYVLSNMNTYWVNWIHRLQAKQQEASRHLAAALDERELDETVEWCVLGMLRQYYTLREGAVTSKLGAAEYGLKVAPKAWHGLIREAAAIKNKEPQRFYSHSSSRLQDLIELLQWIHAESNQVTVTGQ